MGQLVELLPLHVEEMLQAQHARCYDCSRLIACKGSVCCHRIVNEDEEKVDRLPACAAVLSRRRHLQCWFRSALLRSSQSNLIAPTIDDAKNGGLHASLSSLMTSIVYAYGRRRVLLVLQQLLLLPPPLLLLLLMLTT